MTKTYLITAGISGLIAVIMSAVGSHLLFGNMNPGQMATYNTAVQMQMYHTLALLAMTFFYRYASRSATNTVFYLFLFGIILFSLPVYVDSTTEITGLSMGPFSHLVPVGGLLFMAGWIAIIWNGVIYVHHKRSSENE